MWHRTASDIQAAGRVRDALRRILQLPASVPIEYKAHGDCLRASANASTNVNTNPTTNTNATPNTSRHEEERS